MVELGTDIQDGEGEGDAGFRVLGGEGEYIHSASSGSIEEEFWIKRWQLYHYLSISWAVTGRRSMCMHSGGLRQNDTPVLMRATPLNASHIDPKAAVIAFI